MEDPNSTLLPYILETLSRKPELCDALEHLCRDIEKQLAQEQNSRFGNVRTSVQRAVNVGQSLGILTLVHETVRVPFNFRVKGGRMPDKMSFDAHNPSQPPIGTGNPNTQQRAVSKVVRPPMSNQKAAQKYSCGGAVPSNDGGVIGGGGNPSEITVVPMPLPLPSIRGRPKMKRRTLPRSRARNRSTTRRRTYNRRRATRARRRSSSGWRRR